MVLCVCVVLCVCWLQSQLAEKGRELKDLKDTLTLLVKEKETLEEVEHVLLYSFLPLSK